MTGWSNDYSYEDVFARQVNVYGELGIARGYYRLEDVETLHR